MGGGVEQMGLRERACVWVGHGWVGGATLFSIQRVHFDRARCLRRRCRCGIHRSATTAAAASSATATATTGLPVICLTYRPVDEGRRRRDAHKSQSPGRRIIVDAYLAVCARPGNIIVTEQTCRAVNHEVARARVRGSHYGGFPFSRIG